MKEWVIVDTENVFEFKNKIYKIDNKVKQYQVFNTPKRQKNGQWNDWNNYAKMDCILCDDSEGKVKFWDQDLKEIDPKLIKEVAS